MNTDSAFDSLCEKHGNHWSAISTARQEAATKRQELTTLLGNAGGQVRPDMNFVVFGSLSRGEWTSGSDVDWSLLVDGQTDPEDIRIAKRIESLLIKEKWKKPGPSGIFGSLSFSHSLVHNIGGAFDDYINVTRRVLLLLESTSIGDGSVRDRVVRAVLARYLEEDTHFHSSQGSQSFVPRFLLNDIVRYWRTIAVDYANKTREHDQTKWALRNVKLRMSRKLIFVAGLIMCCLCHLEPKELPVQVSLFEEDTSNDWFINFLVRMVNQTPLDLVAAIVLQKDISEKTTEMIFGNYDCFLARLNNQESRQRLENLTYKEAKEDPAFGELREISHSFQEGLRRFFFEENPELTKLAQVYAIF